MNAILSTVCAILLLAMSAVPSSADDANRSVLPPSTSFSDGTQACTKCHDDEHALAMQAGPHGMVGDARTPSANKGCESCHGAGGEHAKKEKQFRVEQTFLSKDPADAAAKSAVCTGCHLKGTQTHWLSSEHSAADVTCNDCHNVHAREDLVRDRATQPQVCVGCHTDQKANMLKYSRHPIREGKVVCTDCHNTHGAKGPHMLVESTTNETCYKCHAEKRGPFLFEHEPVADDCSTCHNPHGSVNDALLKSRPPFLCQQCHVDTRHPGTNYAQGGIVTGAVPTGNNRVIGKSCTNCHTQIHGSNHPAAFTYRR